MNPILLPVVVLLEPHQGPVLLSPKTSDITGLYTTTEGHNWTYWEMISASVLTRLPYKCLGGNDETKHTPTSFHLPSVAMQSLPNRAALVNLATFTSKPHNPSILRNTKAENTASIVQASGVVKIRGSHMFPFTTNPLQTSDLPPRLATTLPQPTLSISQQ
jgi:hypothetical protein